MSAVRGEPTNRLPPAISRAQQHWRLWHIILVAMVALQVAGAQNFGSDFTVFRNQEDFGDFESTATAQNAVQPQNTNLLTLLGQFFPETANSVGADGDGGGNTVTGQRTTLINSATVLVPPAPVQVVRNAMNSGLRRR